MALFAVNPPGILFFSLSTHLSTVYFLFFSCGRFSALLFLCHSSAVSNRLHSSFVSLNGCRVLWPLCLLVACPDVGPPTPGVHLPLTAVLLSSVQLLHSLPCGWFRFKLTPGNFPFLIQPRYSMSAFPILRSPMSGPPKWN